MFLTPTKAEYKQCIMFPYLVKCKYLFFTQNMVAFCGLVCEFLQNIGTELLN
jgi:hypothetical protein